MRTQIGKNVLLIIISLGLILQIGTSEVFGRELDDYTYDVSQGNIVIEVGTTGDTLKVTQNTEIVLDNIPKDTMITLTGTSVGKDNYKIEIKGVTVNIIFDNLKIEGINTVKTIGDSTVNLKLVGENVLVNSNALQLGAGLGVSEGSTLIITAESTGKLTATGGSFGAGIGGGLRDNCGVINICGGIISATGGNHSAGIGGGWNSTGGIVNISGGTITANGGLGRGAGIGGGGVSPGGTIAAGEVNISSGIVTAIGGTYGAGIGAGGGVTGEITAAGKVNISGGTVIATGGSVGGSGIGGGNNSKGEGSFVAKGNAFIIASSIGDSTYKTDEHTRGIIFDVKDGLTYGNPVINYDATIPDGETLIVGDKAGITINEGTILTNDFTLSNNGVMTNNGIIRNKGTITNNGIIRNKGTITNNGSFLNNGIFIINGGILQGNALSGLGELISLYTVNFNVIGGNGNINSSMLSNGDSITKCNVEFNALPDEKCRVKEWKVNGEVLENNREVSIELSIDKDTSVTVEFELIPPGPNIFTVSFLNYNGTEISKIQVEEGESATAPPDPKRDGYIFTGWDKEFNDIKSDTIVKANYRQISSGGGDSSSTISSQLVDNPSKATTIIVTNDTVNVNVSQYEVTNAIKKAQADAKKNGTEKKGISIEIIVDTNNMNPSNLSTNIPKDVIEDLIKAEVMEISIKSDIGTIKLDLETLKTIEKQIHGDVNISMEKVDNTILPEEVKAVVGDGPVFDFSVIGKGGKKVSGFGKGKISISLPFTLRENEKPENIVIYYIDSNGNIEEMENSIYDENTKTISFETDHFSKFAIGYRQNIVEVFTDIEGHWAKDDIEFAVAKGLFNGTGHKKFSPDMPMTRGMFVTVLGRLANIDVTKYKHSSFIDVKSDIYYMDYIEWASENGIIKGISQGKFSPDQYINREEMAVVLYRYAQFRDYDTTQGGMAIREFEDYEEISEYALQAMGWTVNTGLLQGSNANLMPKESTTRGQVAAILNRFYKIIIE